MAAPTGFLTVTANRLQDGTGTLIADAVISFSPVDNNGRPLAFMAGGGGQTTCTPVLAQVTNGAFTIVLPDTTQTVPANVGFAVALADGVSGLPLFSPQGYGCFQPTPTNTNFDLYKPDVASQVAVQYGPTGPPTTFLGAWSSTTAYIAGQAVSFGGSSWVALAATTGNEPDTSPAQWGLQALGLTPAQSAFLGQPYLLGISQPVAGVAAGDPTKAWVLTQQVLVDSLLQSAYVYTDTAGTATVFAAQLNGDGTLTLVASLNIPVAVGANTVDYLTLQVPAGSYIGIYCHGIHYAQVANAPVWSTSGMPSNSSPKAIGSGVQIEFGALIVPLADTLARLNAQAVTLAPAATVAASSSASTSILGLASLAAGIAANDNLTAYANRAPAASAGTATSLQMYAASDCSDLVVFVFTRNSDGTATITSSQTVAVGAGYNAVPLNLPVQMGQYVGLFASSGSGPAMEYRTPPTFGVYTCTGLPATGTVMADAGGIDILYNVVVSPLQRQVAAAGLGTFDVANRRGDATSGDAAVGLVSAKGQHPYPYVPVGRYLLSQLPGMGSGFWGPGELLVNGMRCLLPKAPRDRNLLLSVRNALLPQSSTGSPVCVIGDSLTAHYSATTIQRSWLSMLCAWINCSTTNGAIVGGAMEPHTAFLTTGSSTGGGDTAAFYGLTVSGGTSGTTGPIAESIVLPAGASIGVTGAYQQLGAWYNQAPGAGSLVIKRGTATLATVNCAGTAALDKYTGTIATGQTSSATCTFTATGGPVEVTGILRHSSIGTGTVPFLRFAHGNYGSTTFTTAMVASCIAQALAIGPNPKIFVYLMANDFLQLGNSPAVFATNLTRILQQLVAAGITDLACISPARMSPANGPTLDSYVAAMMQVCKSLAVPYLRLSDSDFYDQGLIESFGIHPTDPGQVREAELVAEWLAK